ncbi:hypothetical protein Lepto7376_3707 [[Leptolyngbya] sp. PCC 7376]|uniref:hypothetical protein n=1 Tax=[Leptolyngbya] sp. PCC 7376 TaxID=111781 RepID=UPI00029F147E|nr:hypothetical protein [[Leptolyngbya] sp. PCC 7376]AFY39883.1 hypothetical protein Lepto7376_3707 [[Leptolyngbya] sp. PCC 7376]
MGFALEAKDLISREIRDIVAPEGRIIQDLLNVFDDDSSTNLVERIFITGRKLIGFASKLPQLVLSFANAFGWLVGKASQLSTFNWLASDAQLRGGLKQHNISVASAWGGFFGQLTGTIAVGAVGVGISFALPVIGGTALALGTISALLQERGDELWDEFKNALRVTFNAIVKSIAVNSYIAVRKAIRENAESLKFLPPGLRERLSVWGTEEGSRWSIAEEIEERIDSIPNEYVRAFVEEFVEEGWESFIEGGYVVARFWDEQMQAAKATRLEVLGEDRSLTLELDKDNDGEKVRMTKVPSNLAIAQANGLINQYRLIRNRDIGTMTNEDDGRKVLQPYLRTCKIVFRDVAKPPFINETGGPAARYQLTLKALKPNLRWIDFKRALRNHRWGAWKIEATLESRITILLFAAEKEVGKATLKGIIKDLCEEDFIRVTATEEELAPSLVKTPTAAYPEKAIVTLKRERTEGTRRDLAGKKYEQEKIQFTLWTEDVPFGTPEYVTNFPTDLAT